MSFWSQVSVVIPTYNRASLLGRAIESALSQSLSPDQIIVVDDGSSDNTPSVCRAYGGKIQYVRQNNAGASAARNYGVRLARQPWIAFLDSDDYWTLSHLERIATAIRQTQGAATCYFADMRLSESEGASSLWDTVDFRPPSPIHLVKDATSWALMKRQPTMLQSSVINKASFEKVGGLRSDLRLVHDSYLFCQLGIGGSACAVNGATCIQTSDDRSATRLTTQIPVSSTEKLEETSVMWRDILASDLPLSHDHRRLVRSNLANSYFGLARSCLSLGNAAKGLLYLLRAISVDAHLPVWFLRHGTRHGYDDALRAVCRDPRDDARPALTSCGAVDS